MSKDSFILYTEQRAVIEKLSDEQSDSCVDEIVNFYNNNIGTISTYAFQVLKDYERDMGTELVIYAMQKAVEANARNIRYIKAILNSWDNKGIKTLIEAKQESEQMKMKGEQTNDGTGKYSKLDLSKNLAKSTDENIDDTGLM